jgi:Flp pilus assembly protein TadG
MGKLSERGAAAVEFALVVPLILAFLLGIIEFGNAYNTQISLTQAAREGARVMAITDNAVSARSATKSSVSLSTLTLVDGDIKIHSNSGHAATDSELIDDCSPGYQVNLVITHQVASLTGFLGPFSLSAYGSMRCGG